VIGLGAACRRVALGAPLALIATFVPLSLAAQTPLTPPPSGQAALDFDAERENAAPVQLDGETIIWITVPIGPYSPALRADRINRRLREIVRDRTLPNPSVTVTEADGSSELRVGRRLVMVITAPDARSLGTARPVLAQEYARELEAAIRADRARYAPGALMRSATYGLLATAGLAGVVWLIGRVMGRVRRGIKRVLLTRARSLHMQRPDIASAGRIGRAVQNLARALHVLLILLAANVYLTYVLGLFPWTRGVSHTLLDYAGTPIRSIGIAFVHYLPKLLFLVVIAAIVYAAIRLVGLFFRLIAQGRITFANFPADWAVPTNKIVRALLCAFGVVVAFPYLPASDSPAFAGVSVFMGVLISLASSSALSNMMAGIVLTYTSAFRLGDRVKLGESFGDIVETSLLATHIRTIKNEDITVPNSLVLAGAVVNYSRGAAKGGLILHTSVTIGYDAPWRQIHELLIAAALETPGILADPRPFVWQTALNDFYVTYEINAYTAVPRDMIDIYAALHARIQDAFFQAGVEIMSPHYTAIRDGNAMAIPESFRPKDYQAPAFRVEDTAQSSLGGSARIPHGG
jgi:small-conductance mechanosensitive channel